MKNNIVVAGLLFFVLFSVVSTAQSGSSLDQMLEFVSNTKSGLFTTPSQLNAIVKTPPGKQAFQSALAHDEKFQLLFQSKIQYQPAYYQYDAIMYAWLETKMKFEGSHFPRNLKVKSVSVEGFKTIVTFYVDGSVLKTFAFDVDHPDIRTATISRDRLVFADGTIISIGQGVIDVGWIALDPDNESKKFISISGELSAQHPKTVFFQSGTGTVQLLDRVFVRHTTHDGRLKVMGIYPNESNNGFTIVDGVLQKETRDELEWIVFDNATLFENQSLHIHKGTVGYFLQEKKQHTPMQLFFAMKLSDRVLFCDTRCHGSYFTIGKTPLFHFVDMLTPATIFPLAISNMTVQSDAVDIDVRLLRKKIPIEIYLYGLNPTVRFLANETHIIGTVDLVGYGYGSPSIFSERLTVHSDDTTMVYNSSGTMQYFNESAARNVVGSIWVLNESRQIINDSLDFEEIVRDPRILLEGPPLVDSIVLRSNILVRNLILDWYIRQFRSR